MNKQYKSKLDLAIEEFSRKHEAQIKKYFIATLTPIVTVIGYDSDGYPTDVDWTQGVHISMRRIDVLDQEIAELKQTIKTLEKLIHPCKDDRRHYENE